MNSGLIAFLAAISLATWVYSKFSRSTGGNVKNSLIGAAIVGGIVFLVVFSLLKLIPE